MGDTRTIRRYFTKDIVAMPELPAVGGAKSVIDKLGLGPEVVRLRKAGLTQEEIAIQLSLSRTQVSDWLSKYNNMGVEQRGSVHKRSVFELADRVQDVFEDLYVILEDIRGNTEGGNRELEVKVLDKVLKAIDMAGNLVEKIEIYKSNERFKEVVLDLLDQEAPGIKAKALRKLSEYKEGISALRPL